LSFLRTVVIFTFGAKLYTITLCDVMLNSVCFGFFVLRQARKSRDFGAGFENETEEYRPMKSTARAAPVKNYRLPHISFAGRLEKELMVGSVYIVDTPNPRTDISSNIYASICVVHECTVL
jgi:hypothetical protein